MSQSIKVHLIDGTVEAFKHQGRSGGSYTKTIKYEGNFAIVEDEWGNKTVYPSERIAKIETTPTCY